MVEEPRKTTRDIAGLEPLDQINAATHVANIVASLATVCAKHDNMI